MLAECNDCASCFNVSGSKKIDFQQFLQAALALQLQLSKQMKIQVMRKTVKIVPMNMMMATKRFINYVSSSFGEVLSSFAHSCVIICACTSI
jgi:hypothetical protein